MTHRVIQKTVDFNSCPTVRFESTKLHVAFSSCLIRWNLYLFYSSEHSTISVEPFTCISNCALTGFSSSSDTLLLMETCLLNSDTTFTGQHKPDTATLVVWHYNSGCRFDHTRRLLFSWVLFRKWFSARMIHIITQCHYVHHKTHMHWPGIEPRPPR